MKILIADDGLTTRTMLYASLSKWGHEAVTAADGNEAWDIMQKKDAPKFLILDWMMPGMNGLELCRKLRSKQSKEAYYIILLTSKSNPQDIEEGLMAGADDFMSKPYDNNELYARINTGMRILELQAPLPIRQSNATRRVNTGLKLRTLQEEKPGFENSRNAFEQIDKICQQIDQTLQSVLDLSDDLLSGLQTNDTNYKTQINIKEGMEKIGILNRRIMHVSNKNQKI
jgi:DNA-binding response OmpR family regulator